MVGLTQPFQGGKHDRRWPSPLQSAEELLTLKKASSTEPAQSQLGEVDACLPFSGGVGDCDQVHQRGVVVLGKIRVHVRRRRASWRSSLLKK